MISYTISFTDLFYVPSFFSMFWFHVHFHILSANFEYVSIWLAFVLSNERNSGYFYMLTTRLRCFKNLYFVLYDIHSLFIKGPTVTGDATLRNRFHMSWRYFCCTANNIRTNCYYERHSNFIFLEIYLVLLTQALIVEEWPWTWCKTQFGILREWLLVNFLHSSPIPQY